MPKTAANAATRIVISNVIGMNAGQLLKRPPADVERVVDHRRVPLHEEAAERRRAGRRSGRSAGSGCVWNPIASASPSTGNGE